ncbi:MAG TPA: valine--tRNA ligase [Candidatus Saccharimonadales bacterium]|nr:valine--tRNA ligase [Candidatus Saccharimonadales bacterium]
MKLAKVYEPQQYEPTTYALWEASNAFAPSEDTSKGTYSIIMPPPNANGNLHIGHALTLAVEDLLVRYQRLQGKSVVLLPGADHAGFETWVVYERALEKEGKSRFDFTREELYQQVWDFVAKNRGNMELQVRELGTSCDWGHLTFTLDQKVVETSYDTFKRLWEDDLIYRGERIVNYCTTHGTSFADIEVEYKNEKSYLWNIAYPLAEGQGEVIVATTRPETMLGDTAVAVHPEDERYKHLIGKELKLPLTNRTIPIIADKAIEREFGTGAVKVTPAHDPTDFEIGERHNLPIIQVIGFDGKMTNEVAEAYQGLTVTEARNKIVERLDERGVLRGKTELEHSVGHCYKCGTVIEPMIKDQWFVRIKPLAAKAIKAIENGDITFYPVSKRKALLNYLSELKDWNISRQIAWGIPIPAFQNIDDSKDWVFDHRVDQETVEVDGKTYQRDPDVFDTWFSSGQWPYITTDYLSDGDLAKFYPNSVMETGFDILFPWVSRMIMLGLYRTDQVPFKDVYLHGLVLDEHGQKMSKSKGNVLNPQDIIAEYGSDALRMGLLLGRSPGLNQAFGRDKIIAARNFCNKLWNMARLVEDKVGDEYQDRTPSARTPADHWLLERLALTSADVQQNIDSYRLAEATEAIYHLIWDDIADWYLESSKVQLNKPMLAYALETILKLAHPFVPFVTETIWQTLKWEEGMVITSQWPEVVAYDKTKAEQFRSLMELVRRIRLIQDELGSVRNQTLLHENDELINDNAALIGHLAKVTVTATEVGKGLRIPHNSLSAWLEVTDDELVRYREKLAHHLTEVTAQISQLEKRLGNDSYVQNAPEEIVSASRTQLTEAQAMAKRLESELSSQESLAN